MEEDEKEETERIPGVEQAEEVVGMAHGVIDKIGSFVGGIFGVSSKEKK